MKLYRPVKTNRLNQGWGTRGQWYRDNGIDVLGHTGYDWDCWRGEPIYHSGDWNGVAKTEVDSRGGIGVDVINAELGYKLRYWHLKKVNVYDGQKVKFGDIIGWGNNTGFSTGDHLHWALKTVDKNGRTTNTSNGYYGAIDPTPYFENKSVQEVLLIKLTLMRQLLELTLKIRGIISRRKHTLQ